MKNTNETLCECGHAEWHHSGQENNTFCAHSINGSCSCKKFTPQSQGFSNNETFCECGMTKEEHYSPWKIEGACEKFTPQSPDEPATEVSPPTSVKTVERRRDSQSRLQEVSSTESYVTEQPPLFKEADISDTTGAYGVRRDERQRLAKEVEKIIDEVMMDNRYGDNRFLKELKQKLGLK